MAPWITDEMHPLYKEKVAKNTDLEEEERIKAGLEVVSRAVSENDSSSLLYIAGSFMFPEKVRESAGEKVVEHYSKEKNERWLSTLSRRPEYHKKTSEAARLALDLIEIKKKRAAALKRLEGSRLAAQPKKKARS